jgi:hypothetical protein
LTDCDINAELDKASLTMTLKKEKKTEITLNLKRFAAVA